MNLSEYREQVSRIPYGKRLPGALYLHRDGLAELDGGLGEVLNQSVARCDLSAEFNVVKFRTEELKVSFLAYPGFWTEAHPALQQAITVDLVTGEARRADYTDSINPPILHRKEQMLPAEHPQRAEFLALTEAEEAEGLYADTRTIGFRLNWERLLSNKGLSIEGHTLNRIEGDWIEAPADGADCEAQHPNDIPEAAGFVLGSDTGRHCNALLVNSAGDKDREADSGLGGGLCDFDLEAVGDGLRTGVLVDNRPEVRAGLATGGVVVLILHGRCWLGGCCFVDEFEAAVLGDALGQGLSAGEVVHLVNGADWFGFFVAHVNNPNRDFFAFVVLVGLRAVEEDPAPRANGGGLVECRVRS
ncbi:MAG TPA: hypothetical protein VNZ64_15350 [Candidatus Acidoferrum sp.]|nr:hypothetical protein [Candidatus Acidoferrum sp.]